MDLSRVHNLTYICPECKERIFRDIQYINPALFVTPSRARITVSHWCKGCNAKHEFTFSLEEIEKKVRVHTYSFLSNGINYNKKLRLKEDK